MLPKAIREQKCVCVCVCGWVGVRMSERGDEKEVGTASGEGRGGIMTIDRPTPPPLVLPHPLSFPRGGWGTVTCSTQNFSLQLTVLLWQNHHPRVLPKAFQWKVVSMCKSSRSSRAKKIYTELVKE